MRYPFAVFTRVLVDELGGVGADVGELADVGAAAGAGAWSSSPWPSSTSLAGEVGDVDELAGVGDVLALLDGTR